MSNFTWRRAVIKVGSALVCPQAASSANSLVTANYIKQIVSFIVESQKQGKEVILVSSGSIALARKHIRTSQVATIAEKQAMAAVGQTKMMAQWSSLFSPQECAQMLVTVEDLADRKRFVNVKNTLEQLLVNKIIPIVNENDTVAVDEIKVGDNDNLAAHTAIAAQADCLIICTDVDGLYTSNPRTNTDASLIEQVPTIDQSILSLAGGAGSDVGTGGMITKLQAAQKCTKSGIQTLLVNGTKADSFLALAKNRCNGTLFLANASKKKARRDWLAHTSKVKGQVSIDNGAAKALLHQGASLLAAGITQVTGLFNAGDSIEILSDDKVCAKGLSNYSSTELSRIKGCKSANIEQVLGYTAGESVVHRDNVVLLE